jgi:hypothetical protein
MKMSDLINEADKATGIASLIPRAANVAKKGFNYLTKPQGLYKTEADRIAAQTAQNAATAAKQKSVSAADRLANAGSLEKQARLQKTATTAAEKAKIATQNLKAAPAPTFTKGQDVARGAIKASVPAGAGAAVGAKFLGGEDEPATTATVEPVATQTQDTVVPQVNTIPNFDNEEEDTQVVKESIMDILKLSGQRKITERDNIAGIIKPAEIKTLTESAIAECGMGMSSPTTASFSINATAGSGEEVAGMLMSIMQLAGVKPVTQNDMPIDHIGHGHMSMDKALNIMGGDDVSQSHGDLDNDGDHDMDDHDMEKDTLSGMDTLNPGEREGDIEVISVDSNDDKEKPIDEFANTPGEGSEVGTDVPVYDPEKMVFRPNTPGQGDRMDGTMPKGNPGMTKKSVREDADTTSDLFKAYEAFKNGQ